MPAKKKKSVTINKKDIKADLAVGESFNVNEASGRGNIDSDPFINNYLLSWQTPEFIYHKKSVWWYVFASTFLIIIMGVAIYLKEWLALVVFLILSFLIFRYAEVKPRDIEISITTVGIKVRNTFYPYNKLNSFWLVYEPPIKTLNLETTKRFSPIITIQLEDTDPFLVKNILKEHILEETEKSEDLVDRVARFLRF